ncbi:MAG: YdeI/OmpD-associated family protein [Nannocystaceae bacterium]|nr:YdeI/OmpD-associated family protein [bacterium]
MITIIEDYFDKGCGRCDRFDTPDCSARRWADGLSELRRICLQSGLEEAVKWGHPCYMHAERNIAILGAFRSEFRLSFFRAALMKDPQGLLEKPGPNTAHAESLRFTDAKRVLELEPTIHAYLREAMDYAEAGIDPPKAKSNLVLPDALVDALTADPELAEAFERLTPGRKKSYVLHVSAAKKEATRVARVAKARPKILAGKGNNER